MLVVVLGSVERPRREGGGTGASTKIERVMGTIMRLVDPKTGIPESWTWH